MSDPGGALLWAGILAGGLLVCALLRRAKVPVTYIRDLLHVGAGIWVMGWFAWQEPIVPIAITLVAVLVVASIPMAARRVRLFAAVRDSVSDGDERWSGLVFYTLSFAAFTALGFYGDRTAAASALWALSLGDGIGGALGRIYGTHHFTVPGGKKKSLEGSAAVALFAALGALAAGWWTHAPAHPVAVGLTAAIVEALSPRATDNLLIPAAVYAVLRGLP